MFSYKPLNIMLAKRDMNKGELRKKIDISTATLAKLGKNEYVSMDVLNKICEALDCKIEDIVEYIHE